MPFYDLVCQECESEFTARATMAEKTEKQIECPECGSKELATVYKSAPAYIKPRADKKTSCPHGSPCGASCPMAG